MAERWPSRFASPRQATSAAPSRCASGYTHAFATVASEADVVLLAGDLTTHGEPDQAVVLADACRPIELPIYAVLGNHDFHANRCDEVVAVLEDAGIRVLQRDYAVHEVGGLELGIVGAKGFVGGFPGAELHRLRRAAPARGCISRDRHDEVDGARSEGLEAIAGLPPARRAAALRARSRRRSSASRSRSGRSSARAGSVGRDRSPPAGSRAARARAPRLARGPDRRACAVRNVAVHVTGADFELFEL